ncbi:toxic anion resistance protein [Collinsella ihumii]|uniref:toxic anion resistance protein n=1 Tax=Collinsella ihumii TaxID=1720204 RepID=UPI0009AF2261|nr:toxic anion resistance protein [Collinsella ihumii]
MLSPADQQRARELAATIDFTKSGIESTYARDAQRSMSDFADNVLAKTSNKATGEAGALLRELLVDVESAELSGVKQIPIIGKVVVGIDKLRRTYQKVAPQVDEVVEKLERAQAQMIADIAMYDTMYQRNVDQYRSLKVYIAAGRQALADLRAEQLPALEAEAASTGDAMGAQVLKDFKDKLDRFDKRLDDLDRVSIVSLQMAPQIKLLQNADKSISDKIDTTISTTIPLWKSQMVIALGLANQRAALDLQNHVDDTTNKLLRANAEALQQGAVDAERATQRGSVDIETLEEVNKRLIDTLNETIKIQQEGRAAREDAAGRMRQIESDLKTALLEAAGQ